MDGKSNLKHNDEVYGGSRKGPDTMKSIDCQGLVLSFPLRLCHSNSVLSHTCSKSVSQTEQTFPKEKGKLEALWLPAIPKGFDGGGYLSFQVALYQSLHLTALLFFPETTEHSAVERPGLGDLLITTCAQTGIATI